MSGRQALQARIANLSSARMSKVRTKLERLNPGVDIEAILDTSLEAGEAQKSIATRYHLKTQEDKGFAMVNMKEFANNMSEQYGISNRRIQNLVAMTDPPMTEAEMGQLSYAVTGRSYRAMMIDRAKHARAAKSARQYGNNPNRFDVATWDNKPAGHVTKTQLKKTNRPLWKKKVAEDKHNFEMSLF